MAWSFYNSSGQLIEGILASSIDSAELVAGSIDTVHIDDLQVTGAKIAHDTITEGKLDVSNGPTNGQFLQAQSGEGGGLTWAAAGGIASVAADTTPQVGGSAGFDLQAQLLVGNGGTTGIAVSANGEVTMAAQPAFLAKAGAVITNVTGNQTAYTMVFSTEIFDQNADFDGTSTFTAPVTGKYRFHVCIGLNGVTAAGDNGRIRIIASNRKSEHYYNPANNEGQIDVNSGHDAHLLVDMDASDTVTITLRVGGESSDVVDISGGADLITFISGELVV